MPPAKPQRVSQADLARELGLSQSLVSMVLNGRRDGISQEAYDRIWECARRHGYRPRGMNLQMAVERHSRPLVGYILRAPLRLATTSNFFSHVAQGLFDHLGQNATGLFFLGSEADLDAAAVRHEIETGPAFRGLVILGEVSPSFLLSLSGLSKPLVYVSARQSGVCHCVLSNDLQAADLVAGHLADLGHTRFGWLGGDVGTQRELSRREALGSALSRRGLSLPETAVSTTRRGDRLDGYEALQHLSEVTGGDIPSALVCVNALVARGAITWLLEHGFRVGSDISVAAYDATRVCHDERPGITGAASDPEEMGREAARIVLEQAPHSVGRYTESILPATLTARASTGRPQRAAPAAKPAAARRR